jgi:hypothetical protein
MILREPGVQTSMQWPQLLQSFLLTDIPLLLIEIALAGQATRHFSHLVHKESLCTISGQEFCDSGFEHHEQRKGQPFKKTVVLIPGPS